MHKVSTLEIFVRNRSSQGWTQAQIVHALRQRMKWNELDPDKMDDVGRERYREVDEFLQKLEEKD